MEKVQRINGEDIIGCIRTSLQMSKEQYQMKADNEVLILLQEELDGMGSCLEKFGLPAPDLQNQVQRIPKVIAEEMYNVDSQQEISNAKSAKLNMDQHDAFCAIMKAVQNEHHLQRLFFLNALGGYGKTFLIEALLSSVRGMGKIALAVASSGIAAELLEGGKTAHSWFKISIPINESSVCSVSLQSDDAKMMRQTSLNILG